MILTVDLTAYVNVPICVIYREIYSHSLIFCYYPKKQDQKLLKASTFLGCPISYDGLDCSDDVESTIYDKRSVGRQGEKSATR